VIIFTRMPALAGGDRLDRLVARRVDQPEEAEQGRDLTRPPPRQLLPGLDFLARDRQHPLPARGDLVDPLVPALGVELASLAVALLGPAHSEHRSGAPLT
jgi:hypothetical protein